MSDTEELKQNYLRENILDKGYEAEDFVSYLTSKKGEDRFIPISENNFVRLSKKK